MTYGVYSRDLKHSSASGKYFIDEAKKWCYGDCVVCSEKKYWCGWTIRFCFHGWSRFRFRPRYGEWHLGFVNIEWHTNRYTWADKIVYDPKKESEVSNGY